MEVDPDRKLVRCVSCRNDGSVWNVRFYCSCGNAFNASDVRTALEDIIATSTLLERIVLQNLAEAQRARSLGQDSLAAWIGGIAQGIGGSIGGLLGSIAGSVVAWLFGPRDS